MAAISEDWKKVCAECCAKAEQLWAAWKYSKDNHKYEFEEYYGEYFVEVYGFVYLGEGYYYVMCSEEHARVARDVLNARRSAFLAEPTPAKFSPPPQQPQKHAVKPVPSQAASTDSHAHQPFVQPKQKQESLPHGSSKARIVDVELPQKLTSIFSVSAEPLVDLRTAIQPLVPHVPHIQQQAEEALEFFEDEPIPFGVDLQQAAAIRLYTVEGVPGQSLYNKLNAALRSPNRPGVHPYLPYMRLLNEGLQHVPKWTGSNLWRGMHGDLRAQHPDGKQLTWWGYSSSTTHLNSVSDFLGAGEATLFCISNASHGVQVNKFSSFPAEAEVLLPAGTVMTAMSSTQLQGTNKYIVDVRVEQGMSKVL